VIRTAFVVAIAYIKSCMTRLCQCDGNRGAILFLPFLYRVRLKKMTQHLKCDNSVTL